MKHIVAILWPHLPITMVTLTTLCLHPSMRLGSMGTKDRMYMCPCVCVCENGGTQICGRCQHSNKDTHPEKKNLDCLLSRGSSGTVVPLWPLLFPDGFLWVLQRRLLESPLLLLHQILLKPTNDWDYTVASSPSLTALATSNHVHSLNFQLQ